MTRVKIFVFTDANGTVVGSFQPHPTTVPGAPTFHPLPHGGSGQRVVELDAPSDVAHIDNAEQLHRRLAQLVREHIAQ